MLKITESAATLPAQDIARARKFYEQRLGLTPAEVGQDGGVVYKTGTTGFLVFPSTGKPSGDHTQLSLDVENVEATVNELKKSGVKFACRCSWHPRRRSSRKGSRLPSPSSYRNGSCC